MYMRGNRNQPNFGKKTKVSGDVVVVAVDVIVVIVAVVVVAVVIVVVVVGARI